MLTVGQILKKEREKRGYSLLHIEKKIRVREKFLRAVEDDNWTIFSSKIYIAGIIKNYSLFLGVDPQRALAFFRRDYGKKEDISFKKAVSSRHLIPQTRLYTALGLAVLTLVFIGYFAYQLTLFITPPRVLILEPKTSVFNKQDRVMVVGKTEKEAVITIFKDRVFQNKDGIFVYDYALHPGKNTLLIEVTGANGKKTSVEKAFYTNP